MDSKRPRIASKKVLIYSTNNTSVEQTNRINLRMNNKVNQKIDDIIKMANKGFNV